MRVMSSTDLDGEDRSNRCLKPVFADVNEFLVTSR